MDKESIFIDFQEFLIFTQSNLSLFFMIKYFSPLSSGHGYFSFFFFPRSYSDFDPSISGIDY